MILVHGSGPFNRDYAFGNSGTDRDLLGVVFSTAFRAHGLTVVRYDKRSVDHPAAPARPTDAVRRSVTTTALVDDLQAVYDWTRSPEGLGAQRVVLLAHSEGVTLAARLAQRGGEAPTLLLGICGPLESPVALLRRQMVESDGEDFYAQQREQALAHDDDDPWPSPDNVLTSFAWWKTWFLDDVPTARRLQTWQDRCELHYGVRDPLVPPQHQLPVADELLPRARVLVHGGLGHTLGPDPHVGPMEAGVLESLVRAARAACEGAQPG